MLESILGTDKCKKYADGTLQKPSKLCLLWSFMLVVSAVANLSYIQTNPGFAITNAALSGAIAYLMFLHCQRCNGVRGFVITLVLGMIVGAIMTSFMPSVASDDVVASQTSPPVEESRFEL